MVTISETLFYPAITAVQIVSQIIFHVALLLFR